MWVGGAHTHSVCVHLFGERVIDACHLSIWVVAFFQEWLTDQVSRGRIMGSNCANYLERIEHLPPFLSVWQIVETRSYSEPH